MPNGDSLYNVFAGASAAEGKLRSAETNVMSIGKLLSGNLQIKDWEQSQTQKGIGAISEALSLSSTIYGGWQAKQEFETAKTGVQSQIARESYTGEDYKSFIGTEEGKKYLESFAPEKTWTLKGGTKYVFGEGEDRYSLGKGTISGIGEGAKYGVKADLSMYKEAAGDIPFYGEKRGLDLGDVVGEKSIFAAGKEKLSNILSEKSEKKVESSDPMMFGGGGEDFSLDWKPRSYYDEDEVDITYNEPRNWGDDQRSLGLSSDPRMSKKEIY
jgi:hypothetical protein